MKYARIIILISEQLHVDSEKAMDLFYGSQTFDMMSNGVSDMHTMSDKYLADEICMEVNGSANAAAK